MSERKATIYDYKRVCDSFDCGECPLAGYSSCIVSMTDDTDKANEIIIKWCDKNPIKTRQSEFLKMFPNANITDGYIRGCPKEFDTTMEVDCQKSCCDCRKEYWGEEVK